MNPHISRRQALGGMAGVAALAIAGRGLLEGEPARAATATGKPVCGANYAAAGWRTISAATGGLAGYRCYQSGGPIPKTYPGTVGGAVPAGVTFPVASLKPDVAGFLTGSMDAAFAAYCKLVPVGSMLSLWPEGEAMRYPYTVDQIKGLHARAYPIFKANAPASAQYGQVVCTYTSQLASTHHPLGQWMAPGLDFYGMDGYQPNAKFTIDSVFGLAGTQIQGAVPGALLTIFETNSKVRSNRAAWFTAAYAWAKSAGAPTYFTFWDAPGASSGYGWDASDTAVISALTTINADSKS